MASRTLVREAQFIAGLVVAVAVSEGCTTGRIKGISFDSDGNTVGGDATGAADGDAAGAAQGDPPAATADVDVPPAAGVDSPEGCGWANDPYVPFDTLCSETFGAEREPLVYERFGKETAFSSDGAWRHVSESSAVVGWETNLPTRGWIEFGETAEYGRRTDADPRSHYLHLVVLPDLAPDTTYHYRVVAQDERGNLLSSPDSEFRTTPPSSAVHIPGDLAGPPFTLSAPGTYVVTADIKSPSTAFNIKARDAFTTTSSTCRPWLRWIDGRSTALNPM